jgi:metal-responsive CopG/Arc/MetJ family transcriptional regulator
MKTVVSIPDDVFEEAERLARRMKCSRSKIFSRALAEYIARHSADRVTEAMDAVLAELDETPDSFAVAAGRRTLDRTEW